MATRKWGETPPISTALPTPEHIAFDEALIAELKSRNNFEMPEETNKRKAVCKTLQAIATEFVKHASKEKGIILDPKDGPGGKLFTFGSYRLGVFGPGSDIDTLVVGPKHVSSDDFFKYLPEVLQKMAPPGALEELALVPEAVVPIIKFKFLGVSIDMTYAPIATSNVPESLDLTDKSWLRGRDETERRSLSGTRVSDEMLQAVPQIQTFRVALRVIKLWAKQRAIYANIFGYPGGVAWGIMVARICQLFPHAAASKIVSSFFSLLERWPWPKPIQITETIELEGPVPDARVWNPTVWHKAEGGEFKLANLIRQLYLSDKRHLMPIITPAYPSMCATHNITLSTKKVIIRELSRANQIVNDIFNKKKQWKDLFERHTFFTKDFKNYLCIISASRTIEAQRVWSGTVESKIRWLVMGIENAQAGIELARPYTEGFTRVHRCQNEEEVQKVLEGDLSYQAHDIKIDTTEELAHDPKHVAAAEGTDAIQMPKVNNGVDEDGRVLVYTTTYYVGIELEQGGQDNKGLDITWPTDDFKRRCRDTAQYDDAINSIRVKSVRSYNLPLDVFKEGEIRPARTKKPKTTKAGDSSTKKRSFAASDLQESGDTHAKRLISSNGIPTPNGSIPAPAG